MTIRAHPQHPRSDGASETLLNRDAPAERIVQRLRDPRRRIASFLRLLLATLVMTATSACQFAAEHTSGAAWSGATTSMVSNADQWVPVAVMVAATPLALLEDQNTSNDAVEDQVFRTNTQYGDEVSLILGLAPIVLGGGVAIAKGDTRYLEVATEAVALTALETQLLKLTVNRERPDGSSEDSFPSGHTSFAFGGATLLARWWSDTHDGSLLGYWLYVPAAYVGVSRLEGDRHYISDITFGAALGIATSHLVWNLHFGDENEEGIFGRRTRTALSPVVAPDRVGLSFTLSF